jgi:hypothetical protein
MGKEKHDRQAMVTVDGDWAVWRFEFDPDGQGVAWQQGRGTGRSVEDITGHFSEMGYTIIQWDVLK